MTTEQPKGCRTLNSIKHANIPRFHCKAVLQLWSKYIHIFLDSYTRRKDSSRCKTNTQLYYDELSQLFQGSMSVRKDLIRGAMQIPQLPSSTGKSMSAKWESPQLGAKGLTAEPKLSACTAGIGQVEYMAVFVKGWPSIFSLAHRWTLPPLQILTAYKISS